MRTWHDARIDLPYGASGEIRIICPRCSSGRRKSHDKCLAVNTSEGCWFCHHCEWRGCLRNDQPYRDDLAVRPITPPQSDAKKRTALNNTWRQSRRITAGDPVSTYLQRRRLDLGSATNLPEILRYHPRLTYRHDTGELTHYPAMLAAVYNPQGHMVSLHRTYLTADGHKASVSKAKKLMSPATPGATRGGAIRLYEANDTLAVTEGIETALAVHLQTTLPVWAAISAPGMKTLVVPDVVRTLIVCADHDRNGTGLEAARTLARRMRAERRTVKILMPDTPGTDWADAL